jgi:twitching motility protein PilT
MTEILTDEEIASLMNPEATAEVVDNRPNVEEFLQALLTSKSGISDVNLSVGRPPQLCVHGTLESSPLWDKPLSAADTAAFAKYLMRGRPILDAQLRSTGSCDCSHSLPNGVRMRVNVFKVRSAFAVVMRLLPASIPTFKALGLPKVLTEVPKLQHGLVLVTGATGSGKSTTMAAIVDAINATRAVHIITLEDPIEFVHPHKLSTVNQRELGMDFSEYSQGLRSALRQGPKVIFVGEIRDRETVEIALKASETGHLVLSTMHTIDAGQTINRITGMFPTEDLPIVSYRLSQTLRFIVGQRLLPKVDGGRVAAREIMGNNLRIQELIRHGENPDRTFRGVIGDNYRSGWMTFDQNIVGLLAKGLITEDVAITFASDPSFIRREHDRILAKKGVDTSSLGELEMARDPVQERRGYNSPEDVAPSQPPRRPRQ